MADTVQLVATRKGLTCGSQDAYSTRMTKPKIKIIAAVSLNHAIGREGEIPWKIPGDLKLFKDLTRGSTLLMGRKTRDSLPSALPGRRNIVLSRDEPVNPNNAFEIARSVEEALAMVETPDVWIIGGESLYKHFMPLADEVHLSTVQIVVPCADAFFPRTELHNRYRSGELHRVDAVGFAPRLGSQTPSWTYEKYESLT